MTRTYPIRSVARLTGISIDTLRAWERRYQAVVPERGERGRLYRDSHISRLRTLDALVRRGHAIGTIAHLKDRQLESLLDEPEAAPPAAARAPQRRSTTIDLTDLMHALDRLSLPEIDAALSRAATILPAREFIADMVLPLLRELGVRWQAGTLTPAQERVVSALVRTVLGGLLRTTPAGSGPSVVFATPSGEFHELGLLAGAVLAAQAGFKVIYLGPDLPAEEIASAANQASAAAIVIGVTVTDARPPVTSVLKLAPKAELFVGGSIGAPRSRAAARLHHVDNVLDLASLLSQQLSTS